MIDTSTTAGKIAVMQAFEDDKAIQAYLNDENDRGWENVLTVPQWMWVDYTYRIKPQTVEEAASDHFNNCVDGNYIDFFKAGAKWQKEKDE